jgi:hypothetical protein
MHTYILIESTAICSCFLLHLATNKVIAHILRRLQRVERYHVPSTLIAKGPVNFYKNMCNYTD